MLTRDWPRLARYVLERRTELGLTQEEVAARGGPSTATIRNIETTGKDAYRAKSLRELAAALGWTQGSPLAILNGREPQVQPAPAAVPAPRPGRFQLLPGGNGQFTGPREPGPASQYTRHRNAMFAAIGPDYLDLKARTEAAPGASGWEIFPDDAVLAQIWDVPTADPFDRLVPMAAYVLQRREAETAHRTG